MCIIIDANVAHKFGNPNKNKPLHASAKPVLKRLLDAAGLKLALGGKLTKELFRLAVMRELVNELDNLGQTRKYDYKAVNKQTKILICNGSCRSNDHHVIALAQISRARLLYSEDQDLKDDFEDCSLIENPRGETYNDETDSHILDNPPECALPEAVDFA